MPFSVIARSRRRRGNLKARLLHPFGVRNDTRFTIVTQSDCGRFYGKFISDILHSKVYLGTIVWKDRAELLRNEEKRFRQDVKAIQLKILEKRNAVNLVKATQDFLLCLRSNPNTEKMDYLIKTFMRIIFKGIYIQNKEIVKVDINEPWKMCYEEGLKWQKTQEKTTNQAIPEANRKRSFVYSCAPSDGRCPPYRRTMASLAEALVGAD